jgi:hypothetical protein
MIPNIVKGKGVSGALRYALGEGYEGEKKHGAAMALDRAAGLNPKGAAVTLGEGEASRAAIIGGQNFGFEIDSVERVELARRAMEWNGAEQNQTSRGRKCENDCLHASLSWEKGQTPSADDMREAAQGFLKSLGMEKAQAVFIAHDDKAHPHVHIVASRIDPETGKTFSQINDFAKAQAWGLQYERQHGLTPQNEARQALHKMVDAIDLRNGAAVVDLLTERSPTFTPRQLDKALMLATMTPEDRAKFRGDILKHESVIGLRDTAESPVTRYTTRKVLDDELNVLRGADRLAKDTGHGAQRRTVVAATAALTLIPEQAEALAILTDRKAIGILSGEAGTGKSHTLKAVRSVYEKDGFNVVGLAYTNKVAQQLRGDGFTHAATITSELDALDKGKTVWNKKTVVVVDEAAMVSTDMLGSVVAAAEKAGAKLILAGDAAQLSSIRRGGLFEKLGELHGAAVLEQVQRIKEDAPLAAEQKAAFNQMHKGEFRGALATFDKAGGIVWGEKQDDALRGMAHAFSADHAADPTKRRFMIASTNAEVNALNGYARAMRKERGELGEDQTVKTAQGDLTRAAGDRIQFTGNGAKHQKNAGLVTAGFATVKEIDAPEGKPARITVQMDTAKGEKPREVSFVVGANWKTGEFDKFKLGYAGTIHKAQGDTLDHTYVCHSASLRDASSYVGQTRHRETMKIFVARDTVRRMDRTGQVFARGKEPTAADRLRALDLMAQGMARTQNNRAATSYFVDNFQSDLSHGKKEATRRQPYPDHRSMMRSTEGDQEARKAALQTLARLFGREVTQQEGREFTASRGGGGRSL